MYPRNAASPERIAIGAVVQISDGAVQTTGVSIKVKPQGGAAGAGGGTTSYEEGIVEYIPTQAETNYTSFSVIAYKTGCIPVSQTIVTSASSTAGKVQVIGVDTDAVNAAALAADAVSEIQSGLATSANQTTILNRIGAFTGSGVNTILGFFQALLRSDATNPSDVGGTYDRATDSLEALRDRGDAAWLTATGFSTHTAADVWTAVTRTLTANTNLNDLDAAGVRAAVGLAAANLDTQLDAIPTATENADALLKRDWTSVTGEAARSVLNALRFLRNKWTISGGTLTVNKEDDATSAWTGAVSTTAGDPVSSVDPA